MSETTSGPTDLPIEVAAQLLKISAERIRQLIKAGYVQRSGHGRVTLVSAVQGYIRSLQDSHERAIAKQPAKNGVAEARQREIEVRTAEREKRLMEVSEHLAAFELFIGMFRTALTALPARVTRDLPLRRTIEKEINGVLIRLAKHCAKVESDLRARGFAPAADPKAAARRVGNVQGISAGIGRAGSARPKPDAVHDPVRASGGGKRRAPRGDGVQRADRKN